MDENWRKWGKYAAEGGAELRSGSPQRHREYEEGATTDFTDRERMAGNFAIGSRKGAGFSQGRRGMEEIIRRIYRTGKDGPAQIQTLCVSVSL